MAKDRVITVMCAARLPEMLVKRMDAAVASGGVSRAQFIAEACRMRLDGPIVGKVISVGTVQPPDNLPPLPYYQVESTDYPGLERSDKLSKPVGEPARVVATQGQTRVSPDTGAPTSKPDMQALRDICAGRITREIDLGMKQVPGEVARVEIPICGKTWWEDGEQYECLMDKGHKEQKHGLRGMVRKLDA